jgi:hypothetical protein
MLFVSVKDMDTTLQDVTKKCAKIFMGSDTLKVGNKIRVFEYNFVL